MQNLYELGELNELCKTLFTGRHNDKDTGMQAEREREMRVYLMLYNMRWEVDWKQEEEGHWTLYNSPHREDITKTNFEKVLKDLKEMTNGTVQLTGCYWWRFKPIVSQRDFRIYLLFLISLRSIERGSVRVHV